MMQPITQFLTSSFNHRVAAGIALPLVTSTLCTFHVEKAFCYLRYKDRFTTNSCYPIIRHLTALDPDAVAKVNSASLRTYVLFQALTPEFLLVSATLASYSLIHPHTPKWILLVPLASYIASKALSLSYFEAPTPKNRPPSKLFFYTLIFTISSSILLNIHVAKTCLTHSSTPLRSGISILAARALVHLISPYLPLSLQRHAPLLTLLAAPKLPDLGATFSLNQCISLISRYIFSKFPPIFEPLYTEINSSDLSPSSLTALHRTLGNAFSLGRINTFQHYALSHFLQSRIDSSSTP